VGFVIAATAYSALVLLLKFHYQIEMDRWLPISVIVAMLISFMGIVASYVAGYLRMR